MAGESTWSWFWGGGGDIEPRMVPYESVLMPSLKADRSCREATFSTRHPIRNSSASYSGDQYDALAGKGRERISVTIKRYGQAPPGMYLGGTSPTTSNNNNNSPALSEQNEKRLWVVKISDHRARHTWSFIGLAGGLGLGLTS